MKLLSACVAVLLGVGPLLAGQSVFRSGVDGVTIQVSVRRGNQPVAGLTTADFELRDNGVPQDISTASLEQIPVDLTLLLDLSTSVDGPLLQRLKTAVVDTARLLRGDDRIRLVAVSQVLHEVFGLRPRGETMSLDGLVGAGATSLYDGLAATMMRPSEPGRRQLIVAFTDGRDSTSIIDHATATDIARLTDAVVDVVVPVGYGRGQQDLHTPTSRTSSALPGAGMMGGQAAELAAQSGSTQPGAQLDATVMRGLTDLVGPTTGQVLPLGTGGNVSPVFKQMLDDFRASYVLQYAPQGVASPGWHEVHVTVKKSGRFDVRARKGYRGQDRIPVPVPEGRL